MRKARVFVNNQIAGTLEELADGKFRFNYVMDYQGAPVSLTMPIKKTEYEFAHFPPFFEGLLPEGILLESVLRKYKLDKNDYFGLLIQTGQDTVGNVTIEEMV